MTSLSKGRAFGKYDADDRGRGCRAKDDVTLQKYDFWEKIPNNLILKSLFYYKWIKYVDWYIQFLISLLKCVILYLKHSAKNGFIDQFVLNNIHS